MEPEHTIRQMRKGWGLVVSKRVSSYQENAVPLDEETSFHQLRPLFSPSYLNARLKGDTGLKLDLFASIISLQVLLMRKVVPLWDTMIKADLLKKSPGH